MLRCITETDKAWPKTQTAACSYLTELHKMLESGGGTERFGFCYCFIVVVGGDYSL